MDADLITIRMVLQGGREVEMQAKAAAGGIADVGAATEATNAKTAKASGGFQSSMGKMFASAERMKTVGRSMTMAFTVPFVAATGLAVKSSIDFSHAMELIHTQAGASTGEVKKMSKSVLDFAASGQSTHGPKQLADSLFHIESVGFRGSKAMDALHQSEALATTGAADMESTTNALVGAMKSGVIGTSSMAQTVATLNAVVGAGNMRMDELTSAMGTGLLSNARQMGVTLPQVGAALAALTAQGQPATASATRFTMAMRMMMTPTKKAQDALAGIGLGADQLGTMMQKHDMPGALALLSKHLDALGKDPAGKQKAAQAVSAMFGARSSSGIAAILQGLDDYSSKLKQINQQGMPGTFDKLHDAAKDTPANRLAAAWARLQAMFVRVGDALIPVVIPALMALGGIVITLVSGFTALPAPLQMVVFAFGALLAVGGPMLIFLGMLQGALTALEVEFTVLDVLTSPWLALALAVAAVAIGLVVLYNKVKWFRDGVNAVVGFIKAHWGLMFAGMTGGMSLFVKFVIDHFDQIKGVVSSVINWIKGHWKLLAVVLLGPFSVPLLLIVKHFAWIKNAATNAFNWVKHAATNAAHWLSNAWNNVGHALAKPFDWLKDHIASIIKWIMDKIKAIPGAVSGIWNKVPGHGIVDSATGTAAGVASDVGGFLGLAKGGFTGPGLTLVGEEGPEIARFPVGTEITPTNKTRAVLQGREPLNTSGVKFGSSSGGFVKEIRLVTELDGRVVAERTADLSADAEARQ